MLLVIGTVRLPPERLATARGAMERMIRASRAEAGCRLYSYAEDLIEPGLVRIVEAWRDQASLEAHFASEHIAEWRSAWPDLGIFDRDLWLYDTAEPRRA